MKIKVLVFATIALMAASCIVQRPAKGSIEDYDYAVSGEVKALSTSGGVDIIVDDALQPGEVRVCTHTDMIENVEVYTKGSTLYIKQTTCRLRPKVSRCACQTMATRAWQPRVAPISYGAAAMCPCLLLRHREVPT